MKHILCLVLCILTTCVRSSNNNGLYDLLEDFKKAKSLKIDGTPLQIDDTTSEPVSLKELHLDLQTISSPFVIKVAFNMDHFHFSCLFAVRNNEGVNLDLCFTPLSDVTVQTTLKLGDQSVDFINELVQAGFTTNFVFYIKNDSIDFYVDCTMFEYQNITFKDIVLSSSAEFYMGSSVNHALKFPGYVETLQLFTNVTKEKFENFICNKNEYDLPSSLDQQDDKSGKFTKLGLNDDTEDDTEKCSCSESVVSSLIKAMPELKGSKGDKGDSGAPGISGVPGEKGSQGPAGIEGKKGDVGSRGPEGKMGAKGDAGIVGPQGPPGQCLKDPDLKKETAPGPKGDTGPAGPPGPIGMKGEPGQKGEMGIKGDTGLPGAPAKLSSLLEADGDGENEKIIQLLQGKKGEKGSSGEKGDIGERGLKGETGAPGKDGHHGRHIKGDQGDQGETGQIGPIGPKGEKGERGLPGLPVDLPDVVLKGIEGPQGPPGKQGPPGERGPKGAKGSTGSRGPQGARGHKGQSGSIGPKGSTGHDGSKGEKGQKGDSAQQVDLYKLKGEKGETGEVGPIGKPGENGLPGTNATCSQCLSSIGPPGPPGPPGPIGLPGLSIVGPKGEPMGIISQNTLFGFNDELKKQNEDEEEPQIAYTVIYKTSTALLRRTTSISTGTLAFVLQENVLLLRVEEGWQHVAMGALYSSINANRPKSTDIKTSKSTDFNLDRSLNEVNTNPTESELNLDWSENSIDPNLHQPGTTDIRTTKEANIITPDTHLVEPVSSRPDKRYQWSSSPKKVTSIRIAALNDPYSGVMPVSKGWGWRGANVQCHRQSKNTTQGTFKAFLANEIQSLDSIVFKRHRHLPVKNLRGQILFDSWQSMFNGSKASFSSKNATIYSFDGRNVAMDQRWPIKAVWHGSNLQGKVTANGDCDQWESNSPTVYGMASPLHTNHLLEQKPYSCDNRLIVLCVQVKYKQGW